jgi:hypothetical protein
MKANFSRLFNLLVRLDSRASLFHHYQESSIKSIGSKISSLRSAVLIYIVLRLKLGSFLSNLRNAKGTCGKRTALVVANGPSCNLINWGEVKTYQETKNLDIFCLNESILIDPTLDIKPNYLLLSDPKDHVEHSHSSGAIWEFLDQNPNTSLITPLDWHSPKLISVCAQDKCLHFVDTGRNYFSNSVNPLFIRTYPPMSIFKLLSVVKFMGYSKIFVIGLDISFFKSIQVTQSGGIIQKSNHYKDGYHEPEDMSHHFPNGIGDYFHFIAQNFLTLRKYFDDKRFINLDCDSLNDTFEKIKSEAEENIWLVG